MLVWTEVVPGNWIVLVCVIVEAGKVMVEISVEGASVMKEVYAGSVSVSVPLVVM
jgi:hypothetical protein